MASSVYHRVDKYISTGWSILVCPYVGVHRRISHKFVPASPACLVSCTVILCDMGGKQPYSCSFLGVLLLGFVQNSMQHVCVNLI